MNHNTLPSKLPKIALVAALAGGALSGCANPVDTAPKPPVSSTTFAPTSPTETSVTTTVPNSNGEIQKPTEEAQKQEAMSWYVESAERNTRIENAVQKMGERVIKLGDESSVGYFDFYNGDKNNWKSKVSASQNAGWGYLQHNPQYGGWNGQISLTAFRKPNGAFDTKKGIKAFSIEIPRTNLHVQFEAPKDPTLPNAVDTGSWGVSIIDTSKLAAGQDSYATSVGGYGSLSKGVYDVNAMEKLDEHALRLALNAMNELDIPK